MMIHTVTDRKHSILVAGVLALISQSAFSGDVNTAKREPEVLTVTAQRPSTEIVDARIETDIKAQIDALDRRFATDLENDLKAIGSSRIELVISEVPTRG
jgi:hypothetical protein